jgi:hypothetical protein
MVETCPRRIQVLLKAKEKEENITSQYYYYKSKINGVNRTTMENLTACITTWYWYEKEHHKKIEKRSTEKHLSSE